METQNEASRIGAGVVPLNIFHFQEIKVRAAASAQSVPRTQSTQLILDPKLQVPTAAPQRGQTQANVGASAALSPPSEFRPHTPPHRLLLTRPLLPLAPDQNKS